MKNAPHSFPAALVAATALWIVPMQASAAGGTTSSSGSACTVTVIITNEDGSTDQSVRPRQSPCRPGQSNGDVEYYNPYTDSYETRKDLRIDPLVIKKKSSSSSRTGTGTSQGGSRSTSGSSSSQSSAGSSGAPCTSAGTSSKAIKKTRSTASGRACSSPLQ
ncbi:MAG: hypothetical protein IPM15_04960 [Betaproteobacteria bacterium]|nr:hypothetical protein [Betaproteobacteria bacterium]